MGVTRPAGLPGSGFTVIANSWVRDPNMSLKARGLLAYLCSHQEGYEVSNAQMVRQCADGKDAVRNARDELVDLGYLVLDQTRQDGRFAENNYVLTDPGPQASTVAGNPQVARGQVAGKPPTPGNPSTGNPDTGNPPHRRTPGGNHQEEQHPTPSGVGGGAQLALVTDGPAPETINQRAKRVADTFVASVGGMAAFMAVRNVVVRACASPAGWDDEAILAALGLLHGAGRSLTLANLDHALNGRVRPPTARPAPYRDPAPDDYARPL